MPGSIVNIAGPTNATLTINGSDYPAGTVVKIAPGQYNHGLNLLEINGLMVDGTSVEFTGDGAVIYARHCINTIIKGIKTSNRSSYSIYISPTLTGGDNNFVLDGLIQQNCAQGAYFRQDGDPNLVWDGTDATLMFKGFTRINCTFDNIGQPWSTEGSVSGGIVKNLYRNWVDAGNTFVNGSPGDLIQLYAIDYYEFYNNAISNINVANDNDNRMFKLQGWGNFYDNYAHSCQGHLAACAAVSFGTTVRQSNYTHNYYDTSRKYSMFEFRDFEFGTSALFTKSNLYLGYNTALKLNTSHYDGFNSRLVDSYVPNPPNSLGGFIFTENNLLAECWQPVTGSPFISNNGNVATDIGNIYQALSSDAVDEFGNSKFTGVGAQLNIG